VPTFGQVRLDTCLTGMCSFPDYCAILLCFSCTGRLFEVNQLVIEPFSAGENDTLAHHVTTHYHPFL
jgi:hypothetical protein